MLVDLPHESQRKKWQSSSAADGFYLHHFATGRKWPPHFGLEPVEVHFQWRPQSRDPRLDGARGHDQWGADALVGKKSEGTIETGFCSSVRAGNYIETSHRDNDLPQ